MHCRKIGSDILFACFSRLGVVAICLCIVSCSPLEHSKSHSFSRRDVGCSQLEPAVLSVAVFPIMEQALFHVTVDKDRDKDGAGTPGG